MLVPRTSRSADGPTGGPAPREVHVWRVPLADASREPARAAMRDILSRYTAAPIEFALREKGKPYLPSAPDLQRSHLSRTRADPSFVTGAGDASATDALTPSSSPPGKIADG